MSPDKQTDEKSPLNLLKDMLLHEEMEQVRNLDTKVEKVTTPENLAEKINPILEQHFAELKRTFPTEFGPAITETLKAQIKESQDEVVDAIYPIMGKMIKKYVQMEVAKLSESVDAKIRQLFSFKGLWKRIRYGAKGGKQSELIVQGLIQASLEEIMVIESESGLLLAQYSKGQNTDADIVAGMLTAIKAFAEDAYAKTDQDLEYIEYETFTLYMQNFKSFYIVVAISGVLDQTFKDRLNDAVLSFAVQVAEDKNTRQDKHQIQKLLVNHFHQVNTQKG